ncbi:MAG TPA: MDR family oxidoreductase [Myxococcaceae bacterium]|nr:MDR family oxidoreductase [Myxococcaceae bacterium]
MADTFTALVAEQADGRTQVKRTGLEEAALPQGEVTIDVAYSSLNYKDGLALTGRGKVIRKWPMVPGIDLAGRVRSSTSPRFRPGDPVLVTGNGLGVSWWGGLSQRARVKESMVLPIPQGLDARTAMSIGTAGFTAALCVLALQDHGTLKSDREFVVTGAAGGVGSIAVALLAALGRKVVASTGRTSEVDYLKALGAADLIGRDVLAQKGPPLASERWGGGVDTVGGQTLVTLCSQTAYRGAVAACGLAGGSDFPGTVFPFILRNVALLGCDSDLTPTEERTRGWKLLVDHLGKLHLDAVTQEVPMSQLVEFAPRIVDGQVRGRVVVNVNA